MSELYVITEALALDPRDASAGETAAPRRAVPPSRPRAKPRAPRSETRTADEAALVLHSYPYKETSLIVDALTRHHGRVALVARGAKRPRSALRGVLLAFQPLTISWVQARSRAVAGSHGGNELRTLTRAEWVGGLRPLRGDALMAGFYLNELLQKLLARDDPHEALFDAYLGALAGLAEDSAAAPILRRFEGILLREAGYGLRLGHDAAGETIEAIARYRYVPEQGPVRIGAADARSLADEDDALILGQTLLDIQADAYSDPATLMQSKTLMRFLLQHHLSGQVLHTRQMMLDLQSLEEGTRR